MMEYCEKKPEQLTHAVDGMYADIWNALRKAETMHSVDLRGLSIKVQNGEVILDGYVKEQDQPLIESTICSVVGVVQVLNHLRTNDAIEAEIWDALWKVDTFRTLDLGSLSIKVRDGEVFLDGNLAQENNRPLIESIVCSTAGVVAVHSHLVIDRELVIQVAQALARDERTCPYILPVDAYHGWIHIRGEVPTGELQHAAEIIAGSVPGVRGVTILPRITGASPVIPHRSLQPRIGAIVYGKDGEVGIVIQVVIQPDNRLVTHVVVRFHQLIDGMLAAREAVIPLEASDLVENDSIVLRRNAPSFSAFPPFDPHEFPLAPIAWQAPFPYTAGDVRWSPPKIMEGGRRSASNTQ